MPDMMQKQVESVSDQIDRAISRFEQRRHAESNDILLELVDQGYETSYTCFCIGRNFLYAEEFSAANLWLNKAVRFDDPFAWTFYELARLCDSEGDAILAAEHLVKFLSAHLHRMDTLDLNPIHLSTLLRIAHRCFDTDRLCAVKLYSSIVALGIRDYLSELRVIESLLDQGLLEEASRKMQDLTNHHQIDPWGMFALARLQYAQQQIAQAVATVLAASDREPSNYVLKVHAGHRLLEFAAFHEASEFAENFLASAIGQNPDLDREINGFRFRLAVLRRNHVEILAICRSPGLLMEIPNWLTVEALFKFALPGEQINQLDIEVAGEIAGFLETQRPFSLGTVLSLYQFYSRRRMWEKITWLEALISDDPVSKHHEVLMRSFETLCAMSKMKEAKAFYEKHYAGSDLRQWESCVVLRFLAEAKMWNEAGLLLRQFINKKFYFPDGDYFLLRICRRTNLHTEILALMASNESCDAPVQFHTLKELLLDDLAIQTATTESDTTAVAHLSMSNRNRSLLKWDRPVAGNTTAVFLCADRAYYLSIMTFIVSCVSNCPSGNAFEWYVFLAQDVPNEWGDVLRDFGSKIHLRINVVAERDFVNGNAIHVENYGIFTGGNTLSRAAFLRIYAAKYLNQFALYQRAIYVDSDIICQGTLDSLEQRDFDNKLIMARAEEASPEVQSVADKHGLDHMNYFNSGVLVFNFADPTLSEHLEKAIHLAENESERLVFHDQCALNIAFKNKTLFLDPGHNFFLRPHRPDNGNFASATLLHFLDKPKPWDLSYSREYRALWMRYADTARVLLDQRHYNTFVAAANA